MSSFLRTSTLKRFFPALLVAGGFLILWLGVLGDLTASVDAALSIPTYLQPRAVCEVGVSSQPTTTYGTLQAGVDAAQENDIVTVMGTCTGSGAGTTPIAVITKSLTVRGGILEGEGVRRLLEITGDIAVTVENLELRGGKVSGNGGGVYMTGTSLILNSVIVANNEITGSGGGLYLDVRQATLNDNVFSENIAVQGSGAALYLKAEKAEFSGNLINNNQAESDGGAFWLEVGEITLDNNTFSTNQSLEGRGGALHLEVISPTEANMSGNIINHNEAKIDGGGFSLRNINSLLLSNNEFNTNKTLTGTGNGGALYLYNSHVTLNNNSLAENEAQNNGGGLYASGNSDVTLENDNEFLNNTAVSGSGGGLYLNSGDATINDSKISGNKAHIHGGGYYANNDTNTLNGNRFSDNEAETGHGGGLYVKGNSATLSQNRIEQNTTAGRGGGMYIVEVDATISDSHIIGNQAVFGGGLFLNSDSSIVSKNIITGNKSTHGGGFFLSNSSAKLSKNEIMTNTASDGGGIFLSESNQAEVKENVIAHNVGHSAGGGLYLELSDANIEQNQITTNTVIAGRQFFPDSFLSTANSGGGLFLTESDATLERNTIRANRADNGGALYLDQSSPTAINNLIADNQAQTTASALYNMTSSPIFLHNTIANNNGGDGRALFITHDTSPTSTLRMSNTILSGHSVALYVEAGDSAILNGTLWYDNQTNWAGAGSIDRTLDIFGSPHFTTTNAGDYRLASNSAAIDVGVNAGIDEDIDLQPRPTYLDNYDIGADEYYNPNVSIDYQVTPDPVLAGEDLTYTVNIRNIGNVFLTATVKVDLPNVVVPNNSRTWRDIPLNPVSPNNSWSEQIPVKVNSNYQGTLRSLAEVTTEQGATISQTITSEVLPANANNLVLAYNATPNPVVSGEVLTYNLAVTNTHHANLYGTVNITLPAEVTPTGVISWRNIHLISNTVWMPSKPITVTVNNGYEGVLTSSLEVTSQGGGLSNQKVLTVTAKNPDFQLDLTATPAVSLTQKDQQLIYHFSVTNRGNTTLYTPTIRIITEPSTATSGEIFTTTDKLSPDQVWSRSVGVTVTTDLYQSLTATITADAENTSPKNLVRSVEANVIEIKQVASPPHPLPGGLITYTLYITNRSNSVTVTATIKDELPQQVTLSEGSQWDKILISPTLSVTKVVTGTLASACLTAPLTNTVKVTAKEATASQATPDHLSTTNTETIYPLHLAPTITATSGDDPSTWNDNDRVYIPKDVVVSAGNIKVKTLRNDGTLQSQAGTLLDISATNMICNNGQIKAADLTKRSHSSSDIQLKAPIIENQGEITAGEGITESNAGGSLILEGDHILNSGSLRAGNGGSNAEEEGGIGGSITLISQDGLISTTEKSRIQSGNGGRGKKGGGDGGTISLMGQNMGVDGEIQSGNGGDIAQNGLNSAGNGGEIKLFGNHQQGNNCSELILSANITSGKGGNASVFSTTQRGGNGGEIYLMSAPTLALQDSKITAGLGGNGSTSSIDGNQGAITISAGEGKNGCTSDPKITLANSGTQLHGQDITLFGGNNVLLDLSSMELPITSPLAISATGTVLLATGANGKIDLRGNLNQIIKGDEGATLAVTDTKLLLPSGFELIDVAGENARRIEPELLSGVSLVAPDPIRGKATVSMTIPIALVNRGAQTDTFKLSAESAGLSEIKISDTVTVLGGEIKEMSAVITPSFDFLDELYMTATLEDEEPQTATLKLRLIVDQTGVSRIYLPLIKKPAYIYR